MAMGAMTSAGQGGFVTESGFGLTVNGAIGYAEDVAPQLAAGMPIPAPVSTTATPAQEGATPSLGTSIMTSLGLITSNRDAVKHMEATMVHTGAPIGHIPNLPAKARRSPHYKLIESMTRHPDGKPVPG